MIKRWLLFWVAWLGCLVFYWAYQQWLAYVLLVAVTGLPALSLVLSLPAMLKAQLPVSLPARVSMGEEISLDIVPEGTSILPPWRVKMGLVHNFSHLRRVYRPGQALPTDHCGQLQIPVKYARVYDYLGLFFLPKAFGKEYSLSVLPVPVAPVQIPDTSRKTGILLRPRRGGGFAENHDLRLYRPGDSLQQIHWKMSVKTGKLILREPLETIHSPMLLRLDLTGSPAELDQKLGMLLYTSRYLLHKGFPHTLQAWTQQGLLQLPVLDEDTLISAIEQLLRSGKAEQNRVLSYPAGAAWWYYIGGERHEEA